MTDSEKSVGDARKQAAEELTRAVQAGSAAGASLDKTLVSLSSGAMVLSMTFVGQIAPSKLLLPLLFMSWLAFAASVLSVVFAMRTAQSKANLAAMHFAKLIEDIDKVGPFVIAAKDTMRMFRDVSLSTKVRRFNIFAISAFSVGLLLLGIFVGYNLLASGSVIGTT